MTPGASSRSRARWVRGAALALGLGALLAAAGIGRPTAVSADATCGFDGVPDCPAVDRVQPNILTSVPTRPVQVTLSGAGLGPVTVVVVEPPAHQVRIVSRSTNTLVVEVPVADLRQGTTLHFGLRLAGHGADDGVSPPLGVGGGGAVGAPARSLAPAPVAVDTPRAAAAPPPLPVTTATQPPGGSGTAQMVFFLLAGLGLGCGGVYLFARRTGLLYEAEFFSDRRDEQEHRRALEAIENTLAVLWGGGGAVVPAGARLTPELETLAAGLPRPTREELQSLIRALFADLDQRRRVAGGHDHGWRVVTDGAAPGPTRAIAPPPAASVLEPAPDAGAAPVAAAAVAWASVAPIVSAPVLADPELQPAPATEAPRAHGQSWGVRQQGKPVGAPPRCRTPPH